MKILHKGGLFGVVVTRERACVILQQVPWEVTTSYGGGTSLGPKAILEASPQLDLFDIELGDAYRVGYFLEPADERIAELNSELKPLAQRVIAEWERTGEVGPDAPLLDRVNSGSEEMVARVYERARTTLREGKIPGLIGGDHSTPLGAIRAVCETYGGDVGVLHVDAHADLQLAYQGFRHSHASIMRNVCALETPPYRLVQVAIRDFCKDEYDFIGANQRLVRTFFDRQLKRRLFAGESWGAICDEIVSPLPQNVYVSFDIDGLSPEFCPNTGTPVPGGLSFDQAIHLLGVVGRSGRKLVGFDLNEVTPDPNGGEWDGNVGARLLFKLCGWAAVTNGLAKIVDSGERDGSANL